jgi:hypothetical protein
MAKVPESVIGRLVTGPPRTGHHARRRRGREGKGSAWPAVDKVQADKRAQSCLPDAEEPRHGLPWSGNCLTTSPGRLAAIIAPRIRTPPKRSTVLA